MEKFGDGKKSGRIVSVLADSKYYAFENGWSAVRHHVHGQGFESSPTPGRKREIP
jgi:hypothetical protein